MKATRYPNSRRFSCRKCGKWFSSRSFSLNYRKRLQLSYQAIFDALCSCAGIRDIARQLKTNPPAIENRLRTMAQVCLATHNYLSSIANIEPSLVVDGFASFTYSKFFPNNVNILVGSKSQYLYELNLSLIRRSGTMSMRQKEKRAKNELVFCPSPNEIRDSMVELFSYALKAEQPNRGITIHSDEHQDYPKALRTAIKNTKTNPEKVTHTTTSSTKPRTVSNPLFPVNYLDRQIRKDMSDHVRKTVQWAKSTNGMMQRLSIYQVYHNYLKPFRIKDYRSRTVFHGTVVNIPHEVISKKLGQLWKSRPFINRQCLSPSQSKSWLRCWVEPTKLIRNARLCIERN